jgi:hypothetical protein
MADRRTPRCGCEEQRSSGPKDQTFDEPVTLAFECAGYKSILQIKISFYVPPQGLAA